MSAALPSQNDKRFQGSCNWQKLQTVTGVGIRDAGDLLQRARRTVEQRTGRDGSDGGQLTLTPTALNFGNVTDGSSAALSGTLMASGSSVTVSSATSTSTEFVVVSDDVVVSGDPYAQVRSNDAGLTYTDSRVSAGQTYYYVVTAVDSTGTESTYSNQAQVVVPSP